MLDKELTHLIYRAGEVQKVMVIDGAVSSQVENLKMNYLAEFEADLKTIVLRVLNLTMGSSKEALDFWENLLKSQVYNDYGFQFSKNFFLEDLPCGILVQACFYHFNVKMEDKKYELGLKDPFKISNILSFDICSKSFGYKSHKLRSIINTYSSSLDNKKYDSATRLLEVKLAMEEFLGREQDVLENLAELCDVYLLMEKYAASIEISQRGIKRVSAFSPT